MPKGYPQTHCKICERHRDDAGPLSKRGKCEDCCNARIAANNIALRNHTGPFFQHWRSRGAAGYGAVLLDDSQKAS